MNMMPGVNYPQNFLSGKDWFSTRILFVVGSGLHNLDEFQEQLGKTYQKDPFGYSLRYANITLDFLQDETILGQGSMAYEKTSMVEKTQKESLKYRKMGNDVFKLGTSTKIMKKALALYTQSIAHATPKSEELALAYGNRSAVLIQVNHLEECLEDIQRAIDLNYPADLKPKIYLRRAQCYAKLAEQNFQQAKLWLKQVASNDEEREFYVEKLKDYKPFNDGHDSYPVNLETEVPELKTQSAKFPCASDALDVANSKIFGRHIVATRDIEIGEVLAVEKPYVMAIKQHERPPDFSKNYTNCYHCLKFVWAGIPCDQCVNAVFCSVECKSMAWTKYHEHECCLTDFLLQCGCLLVDSTLPKLIVQMTRDAGGIEKLREKVAKFNESNGVNKWPLKPEWYQQPSVESILALATDFVKKSEDFVQMHSMYVVRNLFILATSTDFFGVQYKRDEMSDQEIMKKMIENPDIQFIMDLMLKMFAITRQGFKVHEFTENNVHHEEIRGFATMPFLDFANHSCFPNSFKQCKRDCIVLRAMLPIKKGEQVFTSYDIDIRLSKEVRQQSLRSHYLFTCSCIACSQNWTLCNWFESYEKMAKTPAMREEIRKSIATKYPVEERLMIRDMRERNEMLKELFEKLKIVYERVKMPCATVTGLLALIWQIYYITGNSQF